MAFNLGDILVNIKANTDGLKKGLNDVQSMGKQTQTMGQTIQSGMKVAAAGLAVVGAGLTVYAKKATDFTVDLVKSSTALGREIGVSTTEASRLSAAMQRMGLDADKTQQMFGIFSKKINEAANMTEADRLAHESLSLQMKQTQRDIDDTTEKIKKNGDKTGELALKVETLRNKLATLQDQSEASANAFEQLGISTQRADGTQKSFTEILGETADKFKEMPNGVTKTALAMDLFGKSGKDMIKVLNLGSSGIAELEQNADRLGLTLNAQTIVRVQQLIAAQKDLKESTDAMKIAVGTATAPVLTKYNEALNKVTTSLLAAHEPVKSLTTSVLAFGGPVSGASSSIIAFLANLSQIKPQVEGFAMKAGIAGLILVALAATIFEVTQHWLGFKQGVDEIGASLSNVFHPAIVMISAAFQPFMQALGTIWQILVTQLAPAFGQLWQALQRLWQAVNPAFTDALKVLGVIMAGVLIAAIVLLIGFLVGLAQIMSYVVSAISNVINWVSNFVGWMGTAAVATARAIGSIAMWFLSLPRSVGDTIGSVVSTIMGLPGRILRALGNLGGLLYNAGREVINGFINGIESAIGRVKDTLVNLTKKLTSWKGPEAVDKKILFNAGHLIIRGFVDGLESSYGLVQNSLGSLTSGLNGAVMSPAMSTPAGNSTITNNRPVTVYANIQNKEDADYLIGQLDRDHQLEGLGLSPQR